MHRTAKLRRTFGVIGVVLGLSVLAGGAMAAPGAGPGHHGGAQRHDAGAGPSQAEDRRSERGKRGERGENRSDRGARDHQGDRGGDRGQHQHQGGRPQVSVFELGTAAEELGS